MSDTPHTAGRRSKLAVASFFLALSPFIAGIGLGLVQWVPGGMGVVLEKAAQVVTLVLVCIGFPLAVGTGIAALVVIRKSDGELQGRPEAMSALAIVTLTCSAALLALPTFLKGRESAQRGGCHCVLHCMAAAKEQIALETHLKPGDAIPPEQVLSRIKHDTKNLACPKAKHNTYTIGKIGESPRCSAHPELTADTGD